MAAGWQHRGPARQDRPCYLFDQPVGNHGSGGKGGAHGPLGLTHQEKGIDMTSLNNRSISKTPTAPMWTKPAMKATAFVLTGQVAQYGPHSICRDLPARYWADKGLTLPAVGRRDDRTGETHIPHLTSERELPSIRDLPAGNTRNNSQPNLPPNGVAETPIGPFFLDMSPSGRCHGGRWLCAVALLVFRAG
jgi:hypothetical protein